MFNEIEELMQAIEKFKSNISNSENLLELLECTVRKLEQYEADRKDALKQVVDSISCNAKISDNNISQLSQKLDLYEADTKINQKRMADSIANNLEKIDSIASETRNELKIIETLIKNSNSAITNKIWLLFVFIAMSALLVIFLKFI